MTTGFFGERGWGGMKFEINVDVRLIRKLQPKQFRTVVQAFSNYVNKSASDKAKPSMYCHLGRADDRGV